MKVKFSLVFVKEPDYMGGVGWDGGIKINIKRCNTPYRFIYVFLHELIHWVLDAFSYPLHGQLHYWNEILATYLASHNPPRNRKHERQAWKKDYDSRLHNYE